jgi:small subunit ribosomal protein S8
MQNDRISDFLAQIKNAYLAHHKQVVVSYTKTLHNIGKIFMDEQFVKDAKVVTEEGKKKLVLALSYPHRKPALSGVKRVSKPGFRMYVSKRNIPNVYGGLGLAILSTPKGIMTGKMAAAQNVGGEVICKVW